MKIEEILENEVIVLCNNLNEYNDLINHYVLFSDVKNIVGEIVSIKGNNLVIKLIGEIKGNDFIYGISTKPSNHAQISIINTEAAKLILSYPDAKGSLYIGNSAIFNDLRVNISLSKFFSAHFSIIGGTGSGKSFALARLVQTIFENPANSPNNASVFVFDTFGEYAPPFMNLEKVNPNISFKNYTTNPYEEGELIKIPPFLLGVDDLAILLNAEEASQLQVLEKALELVNIFKRDDANIDSIKNDIIARAI